MGSFLKKSSENFCSFQKDSVSLQRSRNGSNLLRRASGQFAQSVVGLYFAHYSDTDGCLFA